MFPLIQRQNLLQGVNAERLKESRADADWFQTGVDASLPDVTGATKALFDDQDAGTSQR